MMDDTTPLTVRVALRMADPSLSLIHHLRCSPGFSIELMKVRDNQWRLWFFCGQIPHLCHFSVKHGPFLLFLTSMLHLVRPRWLFSSVIFESFCYPGSRVTYSLYVPVPFFSGVHRESVVFFSSWWHEFFRHYISSQIFVVLSLL